MMGAIFNSAILDSDTLLSSLRFTQKHSHSTLNLTQTNSIWLTLWWQPSCILPSWIQPFCTKKNFTILFSLNLMITAILNSAILESAILNIKNFTHSFWLNFMMAAILNSAMLDSDTAILDSDTLLSCLRFTQKHSPSNLTLTQTNSFCLKLIHFHLIDDGSHLEFCHVGLRHCHLGFRHLVIFSQIHSKTLSLHSDSDSN